MSVQKPVDNSSTERYQTENYENLFNFPPHHRHHHHLPRLENYKYPSQSASLIDTDLVLAV